MNIVYTINGEGMGHASRSSIVIEHLLAHGHAVRIFSAGERPLAFLWQKFGSVASVMGLHMVYGDNKVYRLRTAMRVLRKTPLIRQDIATIRESLESFHPDVVITDFDFHGQLVASMYHVPVVSIDNIQYLTQARFSVTPEDFVNYQLNYLVAKMMVPHADYYLITAFDPLPIRHAEKKERIFFVPPPLRKKILDTTPSIGEHILVYQTYDMYDKLLPLLTQTKERFIVYNNCRAASSDSIENKNFSEEGFIVDLASAKAVITNGGFNVIAEAVYFRKPVLSIPILNHFEQLQNAIMLQERGLGKAARRISVRVLNDFIHSIDSIREHAPKIVFDNSILFQKLDAVLCKLAAASQKK